MLNVLQLKNIQKDDVKQKINEIIDLMNTHEFDKLKSKLNKMGVFNDVCKQRIPKF